MTGTDGSLPDACTAALTNGAKWGIFLKAPVEGIEKGILWDTGAAMIWSGIEVVITGLTRNHVSTLEVQIAEKPVTMRVCGQVQIVNWGLFYPVVLPDFHGLNFAGKWL